jgi:diguanylate cyclase (GGDEF)-like protein/PAS domain S-box-containing protein
MTHQASDNILASLGPYRNGRYWFLPGFLSLLAIILFNLYQHIDGDRQQQENHASQLVQRTAQQTSALTYALLSTHCLICTHFAPSLTAMASGQRLPDDIFERMRSFLPSSRGLTLSSADGAHLGDYGVPVPADDLQQLWQRWQADGGAPGIWASEQGIYLYAGCALAATDGREYLLINSLQPDAMSSVIMASHRPDMLIDVFDSGTNNVRLEATGVVAQQPATTKILAQAKITGTPWEVRALLVKDYMNGLLLQRMAAPLLLLLLLLTMAWFLWRHVLRMENLTRQVDEQRLQVQYRADLVLHSIEDALISTNAAGIIDYVNPRADKLLAENALSHYSGRTLGEIWPNDRALWTYGLDMQELEHLHHSGRSLRVRIDNQERVLEQNYHPLYRDGELSGIVWILRDISTSVQTRQELEQERKRYMELFEEAGVAHWLLDLSGFRGSLASLTLNNANQAAVLLAGASSRPHLQLQFRDLFTDDGEALTAIIRKLRLEKSRFAEIEMELKRFDQHSRVVSAHLSTGFENQLLVTLIDITEKKRVTERTREQEAFWAAVMAAMPDTVFVANIDDNNTPQLMYRNRSGAETLGYPVGSPDHRQDWLLYGDSDVHKDCPKIISNIRQLPPGRTLLHSGRFRHRDGSMRVIRFEYTPFGRGQDGAVNCYIGTARDVTEDIEKQQQVVESESRYRLLAENMTDIIWATDSKLRFNFVSSSVERLLGYEPGALLRAGVGAIFSRKDIRRLFRQLQVNLKRALMEGADPDSHQVLVQRDILATGKDGRSFMLELQASLLWNDAGQLQGLLGVCRDVTEARQIEQELVLAADVFENSNEAILVTDNQFRVVKVNRAFCDITGYDSQDILGKTPDTLLAAEELGDGFLTDIAETLVVENYWQGELRYRCTGGEIRTGWTGVSIIRDHKHNIQSLTIIMSDVTERKVIEERIHRLAYYDPLTGLSNRSQMHERLDHMINRAVKEKGSLALLFIDLDRFKPINDSMGHPAGDQVLKEVADRLRQCVKSGDLVSRMGGDEFTVAMPFPGNSFEAAEVSQRVAERILKEINQPYYLGKHQVFLSASIGIALYPADGQSVIELLKNADMAMYHAKDAGRNNLQFYDEQMNLKAVELMELENDLHQVIQRKELHLLYQPLYDAQTLKAVGVETLLRWKHPQRGDIPPQVFVPILEDTGLIVPVGRWVLEQSCLQMAKWQAGGYPIRVIAVNVSARQFQHTGFVNEIKNAITAAGIAPQHLELELTETILIDDIDYTLTILHELRTLGVRIAIDDFGTGYSSLNYLKQFPVDMLKIDRSFIQNLPANAEDVQITRTIIAMAHNLGLGVIAEGVENCEQLEFLVKAGCEKLQGFLLSRPLTPEQLETQRQQDEVCCASTLKEAQSGCEQSSSATPPQLG